MSVLKDMIEDYAEERLECEQIIASLTDKLQTYRNRIIEIDAIVDSLTRKP